MLTLNSSQIEAFLACAQTKNFTLAAHRLHITQSALSQRIMNLEEILETTLLIRDRTGLRLTEAGETLLRYSLVKEKMESDVLDEIKSARSDRVTGVLRIGGYSSVMRSVILPSLKGLIQDHTKTQLKMITRELYELPSLLKSGEVDFLLHAEPMQNENLTYLLGHEKLVLIKKKGAADSDVYLDHDEQDMTTLNFLNQKKNQKIHRHYLDDIYSIIDGVHMGLGQAVVPVQLIENDKHVEIVKKYKSQISPVYLIYYQQSYYSKLQSQAIERLLKNTRQILNP
jgi:DNA-binding transcriptional LysR family regulator